VLEAAVGACYAGALKGEGEEACDEIKRFEKKRIFFEQQHRHVLEHSEHENGTSAYVGDGE
jgi:hypothetical protein